MAKQKPEPDIKLAHEQASRVLEKYSREGKDIPRFSSKYSTIVDYLQSQEFKDSKPTFQRRILKQAMEHPQWDLADARGHSKSTGKTFEYFDEDGLLPEGIQLKSRKEESKYATYLNALKKYLDTGNDEELMKFRNKSFVNSDGKKINFITDKDVLDDLATFHQLPQGDDIYIH